MISRFCIVLFIFKFVEEISALVELPQVEENNILVTDHLIRETTDKLFSLINLKLNERPALKQYRLIHDNLASGSLYDYTNLIEVAKLSRVDKTKINNQTQHFIAILNGILEEDIKYYPETEDEFVIKHIEGFIKNLDEYTDSYKYDKYNVDVIISEILNILEKNDSSFGKNINNLEPKRVESSKEETKWLELLKENGTAINQTNEFWVPNARRIYQGKQATIKNFPFIASILIFNHFQCAGSIIQSDLIITAASCLQLAWNNRFFRENPKFLAVRVGSTFHNIGGELIPVLEVYFHPEYEPRTLKNNLCLLRLYRILNLSKSSKRVKKIDIDRNAHPLPLNTDGITIVGWGARESGNFMIEPYLSFAVLDFYSVAECQEVYSSSYVTRNNFCAGFLSRGGGACTRDIGGPGIAHGILAGVVSFGSPTCGTPNAPTVFTKLGYYTDWIQSVMEQDIPVGKLRTTLMAIPSTFTIPYVTYTKPTFKVTPFVPTKRTTPNEDAILRILEDKSLLRRFVSALIKSGNIKDLLWTKTKDTELREQVSFTPSTATTLKSNELLNTDLEFIEPDIKSNQAAFEEDAYDTVEDEIKQPVETTNRFFVDMMKNISHKDLYELAREKQSTEMDHDIVQLIDELRTGTGKENNNLITNEPVIKEEINTVYRGNGGALPLMNNLKTTPLDLDTYYSDKNSDESGLKIDPNMFNNTSLQNKNTTAKVNGDQELVDVVSEAIKEVIENNKHT